MEGSPSTSEHSLYSSYREMLLEHLFAGAVMSHLWRNEVGRLELMRPQVDDGGYDLVLEANRVVRHIQLKSSHLGAKTARVGINAALQSKPSGCVIWLRFDPVTLALGPFLWFGGEPGKPLPDLESFKIAKRSTGNAMGVKPKRPNTYVVPKARFQLLGSIPEVVTHLFGPKNDQIVRSSNLRQHVRRSGS